MSERNILDDPLRALRAARFLATHGLAPDAGALAAARRAAGLLPGVAPERVAAELWKLLESERAGPALSWAARAGILPAAMGLAMSGPRAASLARAAAELDDRTTRGLPPSRRRRLRLAFLAAKLRLSEKDVHRLARQRRWGRREGEEVARLVGLAREARRLASPRQKWRWVLEAGDLAGDAARLLSRLDPAWRRRAQGLLSLSRSRPRRIRIGGDDVVRWLSIEPGPEVGRLLRELRVAAALGEVRSRREARNWLTGQVRRGLSPAIMFEH